MILVVLTEFQTYTWGGNVVHTLNRAWFKIVLKMLDNQRELKGVLIVLSDDEKTRKEEEIMCTKEIMDFFGTKMTGSGLTLVSKLLFCSPKDFQKDLKTPINKIKPNWEEREFNFYLLSHDIHNPMIINYIEHNITKI